MALKLQEFAQANPRANGVMLEAHGIFTWGATSKDCYNTTVDAINRASQWLSARNAGDPGFGGQRFAPLPEARRREIAAAVMPRIRSLISASAPKVGHFNDSPEVLGFVGCEAFERLAALGTSCPDHFLRTKIRPLVLHFNPAEEDESALLQRLPEAVDDYRSDYAAYYERCKRANSPKMRDPNAVVYLIPGVGMITFAGDKATARIAASFTSTPLM